MIGGTFNEWFQLAHKVRTADGQGGSTFTYLNYASEHGRMSHLGKGSSKSSEPNIGEQLEEWVSHLFFCRAGVAIARGDQITDEGGTNYLVLAIRKPSARPIRHIEAECREVEAGN
ncbi:MAG: hypothetical protein WBQ86_12710 [Candidatus Binatus sp.]